MKTILIISYHNSNWGAEKSTCSIAAHLKSLGYRVILIIPSEGKILDIINEYGLEYRIHYFRGWTNNKGTNYSRAIASSLINIMQLVILYFRFRRDNIVPDIIYTNTLVHGFGILLSKTYNVPHIQHIRENIDSFGMKFNWGYKKTLSFINNNSEKIVSTCTAIKDRYINDFTPSKMAVVYNGIPIKTYIKPNVDPEIFTMVYAGRLYMDRRPQDIFKVINELVLSGVKDVRLDVYGNGPMEEELTQYILVNKLEDYIVLKGYQKDIDFSKYYLGFMPAEFEAFARITLEYMMNGLAVVGTNTGGTKEQVLHGKTGYLYTPGNLQEIKTYVSYLYENREECLLFGEEGYERVVNLFSQEKYVQNLSKFFIENIR